MKEHKTNKGWEKLRELRRIASEAKRKRLLKEKAYRYMVGSLRELKRRRIAHGLTERGYWKVSGVASEE